MAWCLKCLRKEFGFKTLLQGITEDDQAGETMNKYGWVENRLETLKTGVREAK